MNLTHRNLTLFKYFNFFLEFRPYAPIFVLYLKEVTGSFTLGLSIFTIIKIASALLEVPTGLFSDMVGRKKTIVLGALAGIVSITLFAIANSYMVLVVAAIFEALLASFFSGNNEAMLYDSMKEAGTADDFSESFGKTGAMLQAGLGTSALLGGYLALWSLKTVMVVSIVPAVICFLITLFMVEPKIHTKEIESNIFANLREAFREFRKNSRLRFISIASILRNGVEENTFNFIPVFAATLWPVWAVGLMRAITHAFSMVSFWFSGKIIKRVGDAKAALIGNFTDRLLSITAVVFPTGASPVLLTGPCYGLNEVAEETLLQKQFTDRQRATMSSINSLFGSICFGLFALALGFIADHMGARAGLIAGEILLLPVTFLLWRVVKSRPVSS